MNNSRGYNTSWFCLIGLMILPAAYGQSAPDANTPSAPVQQSSNPNNGPGGGGFETLTRDQIHDLVSTAEMRGFVPDILIEAVVQNVTTQDDILKLQQQTLDAENTKPELEKQQSAAEAQTAALQKQLSDLDHADSAALITLKAQVADPNAKLVVKLAAAHQFIWSFPTSSLLPQANAILADLNKQDADEKQRIADEAKKKQERWDFLTKGAQDHNLLIEDWREFLRNMTQDEVLLYVGAPTKKSMDGNWFYAGSYTIDPTTQQRSGLVIFFNGTRVDNVSVGEE